MPSTHIWISPLTGYENAEPLPDIRNEDGASYYNLPAPLSKAYEVFPEPIHSAPRSGFDFHIYFMQTNASELQYARELHERIRREFPELRVYQIYDHPRGPHPVGMFEVNVFTPHQMGAFFAWLVIWRGLVSVLVHPNAVPDPDYGIEDHTERIAWIGRPWPMDLSIFKFHKDEDEKH